MRFQRLDLNLLVALDALLSERSVSLAADKLCLSQSATSSALGRLREYFEDDLLVLKGRQMILTSRAEELIEPTKAVLEQISSTIAAKPEFDPATSDRLIRIMASDYTTEVLLAPTIAKLRDTAPAMHYEIQHMSGSPVESLERGHIDLLVTVDFATSADHPSELMFVDDYVVVGDQNNPAMGREMTKELYLSLGHVTVRFAKARIPAFDDWFMRRQKQQRRIAAVVPSFTTMPALITGTDLIATMHRRLAKELVPRYGLAVTEVPFDIPPVRELAQWDIANNSDQAIKWFVARMHEVAASLHPASSKSHDNEDSRISMAHEAERQRS